MGGEGEFYGWGAVFILPVSVRRSTLSEMETLPGLRAQIGLGMSTTERDPRIDPRPGDVLRPKRGYAREVLDRGSWGGWPDTVLWRRIDTPHASRCRTIAGWKRWASNAQVVNREQE